MFEVEELSDFNNLKWRHVTSVIKERDTSFDPVNIPTEVNKMERVLSDKKTTKDKST